MNQLRDETILFFSLCVVVLMNSISWQSIMALLIIVIVTCFAYWTRSLLASGITVVAVFLGAIPNPFFCYFFPLLYYICLDQKVYGLLLVSMPAEVLFILHAQSNTIILLLPYFAVAIHLFVITKRRNKIEEKCKELRDTSEEVNRLLKGKNKALIDKQEYEIHVATLNERNRIAREIHDHVGHMLSRALLQTGALLTVNKQDTLVPYLEQLKETLTLAMNNIRESVHDLHNESIDLKEEVEKIVKNYPEIEIAVEYELSDDIDKNVKYCFIATIKEAFTNIGKHSNATKVVVYLYESKQKYQLNIRDNGTKEPEMVTEGIGLINMKERCEALNGIFQAYYRDGFQVFLAIPKGKERNQA